jgi:hypothetical protein
LTDPSENSSSATRETKSRHVGLRAAVYANLLTIVGWFVFAAGYSATTHEFEPLAGIMLEVALLIAIVSLVQILYSFGRTAAEANPRRALSVLVLLIFSFLWIGIFSSFDANSK